MHHRWLIITALFACINTPGFAESQPSPVPPVEDVRSVRIPEVVVSARRVRRLSLDAKRYPGNATLITAEDIIRLGAANVHQVLNQYEGITIMDQQGFGIGADSTTNLRGIVNSSRTNMLVLVDGVRQNRIAGDDVHWQSIPANQIERIEIIRGGGGIIYGEGALAGVLNIITKQESDKLIEGESGVELGSFGWQQYNINARGRAQAIRYSTNYTRQLLDGYRDSTYSRGTVVTAHAGADLGDLLSLDLDIAHSEDVTAFPGLITKNQAQQRREQANSFFGINTNDSDQIALDVTGRTETGFSGTLSSFWRRRRQSSQDSINFGSFTNTPSEGLSLRTNHEWAGDNIENLFVNGIELGRDKATTGDRDSFAGPDSESTRTGYGLYLEDTLTFYDRLSLIAGMRYDRSRYQESLSFPDFTGTLRFQGFSPKAGITWMLMPKKLKAFFAYSRPFKAPNVDDFSARLGSFSRSNASLKPQQANTYETGISFDDDKLKASATFFHTRIHNEILYDNLNLTNTNTHTHRVGVELSESSQPASFIRQSASYTIVEAEFRKGPYAGNTLPGTPRHTVNLSFGVSPIKDCWVDLYWQLVNDFYRFNDFSNVLGKADNYGVLNLLVQYDLPKPGNASSLWPDAAVYLRVDNLTNEEYSAFQSSNSINLNGAGEAPALPRTFIGGIRIRF